MQGSVNVFNDHVGCITLQLETFNTKRMIYDALINKYPSTATASYKTFTRFCASLATADLPEKSKDMIHRNHKHNAYTIRSVINKNYQLNSSTTASQIQKELIHKGILISRSQIKKIRRFLGFKQRTVRYCQMIRDVNKVKRLEFCKKMIEKNDVFLDAIFVDETTVQLDCNATHCYTKEGDQTGRFRPRSKHPLKLHVFGGISYNGATQCVICDGNIRMDSELYTDILMKVYVPFVKRKYPGGARLGQDNCPTHTSKITKGFLEVHEIDTLDWPAQSPDLNPIEWIWASMKRHVSESNPTTKDELKAAILDYWQNELSTEVCRRYIEDIPKRMKRVIQANGGNIYEGRKQENE